MTYDQLQPLHLGVLKLAYKGYFCTESMRIILTIHVCTESQLQLVVCYMFHLHVFMSKLMLKLQLAIHIHVQSLTLMPLGIFIIMKSACQHLSKHVLQLQISLQCMQEGHYELCQQEYSLYVTTYTMHIDSSSQVAILSSYIVTVHGMYSYSYIASKISVHMHLGLDLLQLATV